MSEKILINHHEFETRAAIVKQGVVNTILLERQHHKPLLGNIYLGTVVRVLGGMQAAFLDIGENRTAFLHANDLKNPLSPSLNVAATGNTTPNSTAPKNPSIQQLHQGQRLVVQVIKEPMGDKGARLTTSISLTTYNLVYLPNSKPFIGISKHIQNKEQQSNLKSVIHTAFNASHIIGGAIIRTNAQFTTTQALQNELTDVLQVWQQICKQLKTASPKKTALLLYQESPLYIRCVRDFSSDDTKEVLVDNFEIYGFLCDYTQRFAPHMLAKIAYHDKPSVFAPHDVEGVIQQTITPRVLLPSGGYVLIEQTEAMVAIDVNSGASVGKYNAQDTAYQTNIEAVKVIAYQLRLRNLGGIIILDFIDMNKAVHRQGVLNALIQELQEDKARTAVTEVKELGLIAMTRERTAQSLTAILSEPCPVCQGKGTVKNRETIAFEIFRKILHTANTFATTKELMVCANAAVIDYLHANEQKTLQDLEGTTNKTITLKKTNHYTAEQYNILPN